jgi:hypothetical protein
MDSSDVMFGIILLGFVLSGMTARAKYLELKLGRKLSEKSRPPAVAPPCLSPGLEDTRAIKPQSEPGRPRLNLSGGPALHTAHHLSDRAGGPIRRGATGPSDTAAKMPAGYA